jgi:predicted RNA-binding Zn ribbon-like protein
MVLPSWVDPDEDKPAPMPLLRVQAFINTLDVAQATDRLLDIEAARAWLADANLIAASTRVTAAQLDEARAVREGLRALVTHNGGGAAPTSDELSALRDLAGRRRPSLRIDTSGSVQLAVEAKPDLEDGLLGLLLTVRDAQADGTWARLKLCANPECAWAFYDRSRNRQGTWCTMAVCGNRLKNRRFRARGHG